MGTNVNIWERNNTDAQRWMVKDAGNGYVYIINKCGGLYLDANGGVAKNSVNIQGWVGNSTNAQKWKLIEIKEETKNTDSKDTADEEKTDDESKDTDSDKNTNTDTDDENADNSVDVDNDTEYDEDVDDDNTDVNYEEDDDDWFDDDDDIESEDVVEISAIKFVKSNFSVSAGEEINPQITINPEDGDTDSLVWETTDPAVAIVDDEGTVTGVSVGTTTLRVYVDENESVYAKTTITVLPGDISLQSVKAGKKSIKLSWKATQGVSGYQVVYSTTKKFSVVKKKSSKHSRCS